MRTYVEVIPAADGGELARAWSFDLGQWGVSATADSISAAVDKLQQVTWASSLEVDEVIYGDERAFSRDLEPATAGERASTLTILEQSRDRTFDLMLSATEDDLDRPLDAGDQSHNPWKTARELAWHFADVESRVLIPALGLRPRPREEALLDELRSSHNAVMEAVAKLPEALITVTPSGSEWTSVKVLRRLAWHERQHLARLEQLLANKVDASTESSNEASHFFG